MARHQGKSATDRAMARLERQITRTRAAMLAESVARAFWPWVTLLMAGGAFWAFGGLRPLGPVLSLAALAVFGLAALTALALGARAVALPSRADAVARLDAALPGRPISAMGDRIAVGRNDAGAQTLWAAHVDRMSALAARARASAPNLQLSRHDPWGLRLAGAVALGAALIFARAPEPMELAVRTPGSAPIASGPSYEAWASPPAYTGRPTLYLTADTSSDLDLPTGSEITLRVYGAETDYALFETVTGGESTLDEAAAGILSTDFTVTRSGRFALTREGREVAAWTVAMIPDAPPTVALDGEVDRTLSGMMDLPFRAQDDYGVNAGEVEIRLDMSDLDRRFGLAADPEPREPILLDLPMPLSGRSEVVEETLTEDLSRHPWAGLPATMDLRVFDAAEQAGTNTVENVVLPGRRFFDPVARALIEQRRDLLWSRDNAGRIDQMLRTITHRPEDIFENKTAYMMTRMALRRLGYASADGLSTAEQEDIAELLWQTAVLIEDGALGDARERLRRAQERLSDALRNGATDEEIAQLMQEMRQAMQDFMQQLAQEAQRNGDQNAQQQPPPDFTVTQDQLQQLLDQIEEMARNGQQEQAEAMLRQLQQMLENMQMMAQQGGQGQQGQGQQTMQQLQDTLRQQQDLADDSFQELQRQFNQGQGQPGQQGQQGEPGQQGQQMPGQNGQGQNGQGQQLADRQEALRQLLDQLNSQLPPPGTEGGAAARERLDDAERSMRGAGRDLENGDLSGALDEQADAMDALREGINGLGEEMQQQAQQNQGETGQQTGQGRSRDPLGRPAGTSGEMRSDESLLPGEDAMRRARELFDEIRRRSGERGRPEEELDYLRRLLDRF